MNEGHVSLHGDMPRYMMNGVFVLDVLRDRPFSSPQTFIKYAQLYYARYPALSLGHHPPLVPVLEAPFYALFGISVRSGRLLELAAFITAAAFLYLLMYRLYDWIAATFAAAVFATSPLVAQLARSVLSEVPALALLLAAAFFLLRFCTNQKRADLVCFVAAATLSLYAKQLVIFVFPAFLAMAVLMMGVKRLLKRDVLLAVAAIVVLTLPLVGLTLLLSPLNVAAAVAPKGNSPAMSIASLAHAAFRPQLIWPVLGLAVVGAARGAARKDWRCFVFLAWTVSVFIGMRMTAPWEPARYSVYLVPAVCALAASLAVEWRNRIVALTVIALLGASTALQGREAITRNLPGAGGYEDAAQFVLASNPGPTVLFSGDIDTGFFTFFVRKHDPERRLVVLRSDKLLTTSLMHRPAIVDRIGAPAEIYPQLRKFGTRFIVIEDRPSESRVLEWLRQELRTSNFAERKRIRIDTADPRLKGIDLVIYEFLAATSPDPDAVLSMNLPLIGRSVAVPLSDLINRKYLH